MENVIAIIPARSGSKGVPHKNIKPLAGIPLLAFSIAAAKKTESISRVIVSTDSESYAELSQEYGAEVPVLRPAEFSGDRSTDYEFVKHMLDWLKDNELYTPDYIVHLRPTTPLRDPKVVDESVFALMNNPEATSLRSAHEMSESSYKTFEIENSFLKAVGSGSFELDGLNNARQGYPKTYSANGYVDVLKTSMILEKQILYGNRVMAFITQRAIEVDTPEDFELLEWMIQRNSHILNKLF